MKAKISRAAFAWAMYDWANSAFATTVMAGFFPVFFKKYWSQGADVSQSTYQLGIANSMAGLFTLVLAPVLGAIADRGNAKKQFLFFFTVLGVLATFLLCFVPGGNWQDASALYVAASIGFAGSLVFYDALLVDVAKREEMDFVSALGFSLGYFGGGILFAINILMTLQPEIFGIADATQAVKISFVSVAVWWTIFSIPLFRYVKPNFTKQERVGIAAVTLGIAQLVATLKEIRALKPVVVFFIGYWLYIDGVDTIIRMAIDYGMSLGFNSNSLIIALLITQFVGFPAAIAFGKLGEKIGAKNGIYIGIGVYILVTVWGYFMDQEREFYILAILIGLVQGGVQSLSRSYYGKMIPKDKSGEFFGFYNMVGKFAAVLGPLLMGWTSALTHNPRLSILSILVLFAGGLLFLRKTGP